MEITDEPVQLASMTLAGVGARTDNQCEAGPEGCIPELWQRFMEAGLSQLPGTQEPRYTYVLYTDYESDVNGAYTVLIGHEWEGEPPVVDKVGWTTAALPESRYIVFKASGGPVQQVVIEAWQYIWAWFESSPHVRTYSGDFERYDMAGFNPEQAVVEIYLAIQ
ncbi:GyrI-like domain-containing protein [Paenibacillus oenotherae]|uniref:GyrI-like domain-containing protein n=2 Tax=Paenibacillus oenotherae TaxID=1435645 RepID=A0ABS7DCI2_9BACL|nr:GyrI-like domain-containing protein [Paenibacillus oenotherae]